MTGPQKTYRSNTEPQNLRTSTGMTGCQDVQTVDGSEIPNCTTGWMVLKSVVNRLNSVINYRTYQHGEFAGFRTNHQRSNQWIVMIDEKEG